MRFRATVTAGLVTTAAGIACSVPSALADVVATGTLKPATPTVTVVLYPNSAVTNVSVPDASPHIVCTVTLSQHVHYSKPGDDISWHWPWSCVGGSVSLSGNQSLVRDGGALDDRTGLRPRVSSGNENLRYPNCVNGTWQGQAAGTFTRPGYTPSSWEGASPAVAITGC